MVGIFWILVSLVYMALFLPGQLGLKDVELVLEPAVVQRLQHSILHCNYDLEKSPLYSVKWYRGPFEFYRFTPSEHPSSKVFPIGGILVDMNHSNGTQVFLRNIEFNLAGNFTCEVTTDETFVTRMDSKAMLVVQLPDHPPTISVSREPLDYGDMLRANCSSSPSKPPATLHFLLNNLTVARSEQFSPRRKQEFNWSDLELELPLTEYHFHEGRLILKCTAKIADVYFEIATLELASARHPRPERVAMDSTTSLSKNSPLRLILIFLISRAVSLHIL